MTQNKPEFREPARLDFDVQKMLNETRHDLGQVVEFLNELEKFKPKNDDKLNALIKLGR